MDTGRFKTGLYPKPLKEPLTLSLAYRPIEKPPLPPPEKAPRAEKPQPPPPLPAKIEKKPPPLPVVKKTEIAAPEKEKPAKKTPDPLPEEPLVSLESYFSDESDTPAQPISSRAQSPATEKLNAAALSQKAPAPAPPEPLQKPPAEAAADKPQSPPMAAMSPQPSPAPPPAEDVIQEAIPLYKENPAPGYPRRAQRRGYQGTVVLEVLVTREGLPAKIRLLNSSRHAILDQAAMASVKKWRFEPGRRNHEKVDMWVKVPIRFRLK